MLLLWIVFCNLYLPLPYLLYAAFGSSDGKRADLLALLYVMLTCVFMTIPYDVLASRL